jgi:hypothetical protein
VKHLVPRSCRVEPKSPRDVHAVKAAAASRERTRYGYTSFRQVAEVGWTRRASCPPVGRKACWQHRALARKKLEALPDAGHERKEGESVRGRALTIKKYALLRLVGFGSQVLQYDGRRSRAFAQLALTG